MAVKSGVVCFPPLGWTAATKVKGLSRRQGEIERSVVSIAVIDCHSATKHFKIAAMHFNRRALVNSEAKQFRMLLNDSHKITFAFTWIQMLVDSGVCEQSKPFLVVPHHDSIVPIG